MNDLTTTTEKTLDLAAMFQGMMELAKDPEVDPAKMAAMLDMQERMIDREALSQYKTAMHKAREAMPVITKEGAIKNKNGQVQSKYATYEAIDRVVRPLVQPLGLSYGFDISEGEQGRVLITCIVSHTGGHEERFGPMPLAVDTTGAKNATQGAGSAASYGQRYTLCLAFNIVTSGQDTDGVTRQPVAGDGMADLKEQAMQAATKGTQEYSVWFGSLTNMQKGFLVDEGTHANCKLSAKEYD